MLRGIFLGRKDDLNFRGAITAPHSFPLQPQFYEFRHGFSALAAHQIKVPGVAGVRD